MVVIYIMSLSRSGSTFLEFLLANNSNIVTVGEVNHVLNEYCQMNPPKNPPHGACCSCGEKPNECHFWGPILPTFYKSSKIEGLSLVLERFQEIYPDKMMVDSSKIWDVIEYYYLSKLISAKEPNISLKVLLLVRDFRAWTCSMKNYYLRTETVLSWKNNLLVNSYRWLYANLKMLRKLTQFNIDFLPVYYDNLIFDTDNQLYRIYDFLNLPHSESTSLVSDRAHELYGSQTMRSNKNKLSTIVYDTSWMYNLWFTILGPLFFPPAFFNYYYAKKCLAKKTRRSYFNKIQ